MCRCARTAAQSERRSKMDDADDERGAWDAIVEWLDLAADHHHKTPAPPQPHSAELAPRDAASPPPPAPPPPWDLAPAGVGDTALVAARSLADNGFVVLRRPIVAPDELVRARDALASHARRLLELARARGHRPRADRFCYSDVCCRTPGGARLDVRLERAYAAYAPVYAALDGAVRPILAQLAASTERSTSASAAAHVAVDSTGAVIALGGAPDQHFHPDGTARGLFNAFVPLVDTSRANGPTELRLGTHVAEGAGTFGGDRALDAAVCVAPELRAGEVLLFDYRVLHRGCANLTSELRPVLYACYSTRVGVSDSHNFPEGESLCGPGESVYGPAPRC